MDLRYNDIYLKGLAEGKEEGAKAPPLFFLSDSTSKLLI